MISYPYASLWLNGRTVTLHDILAEKVLAHSDFETATLDFIRDWLNGVSIFTLKTSGSTGTPKHIIITREQMIRSAKATEEALALKPGYHALICLNTSFIAGKMMIVRSFVTGMIMQISEPSRNPFAGLDPDAKIDFAALVPYQVDEILRSAEASLFNDLKTVIIGGAPLNPVSARKLQDYSCRFYLTYGMTETISHVALQSIDEHAQEGVFTALRDTSIRTDERGCMVLKTTYLAEEVVTNDQVEILSEKKFRWLGRIDNVINTRGVKVHPEKIEFQIEKIIESLNVEMRFFIAGIPDEKANEIVALFMEGNLAPDLIDLLRKRLKDELERAEVPKHIIFIGNFTTTASGKLDRRSIVSHYLNR